MLLLRSKLAKTMVKKNTYYDRQVPPSRRDKYDPGEFRPNLVFVSMWFGGPDSDQVFAAIREECSRFGLHARRVDENFGSGYVMGEVVELIEQAEFLIFDLTGARQNVYYEFGYAHGVGNDAEDVLAVMRAGTEKHFNLYPFRVHEYASIEELRKILKTNLDQMISFTRRGS